MNIGSLIATMGLDTSELNKGAAKAADVFNDLNIAITDLSEEAEESFLKLFRNKMPDAFNTMRNQFSAMQDETLSFVEYIKNNMPGVFQKVAAEVLNVSNAVNTEFKESEVAVDGVAGSIQLVKEAMANMGIASERRKALMDEEIQSLIELQLRKQAAYDPDEIIKYEKEIKNVQNRIKLLTTETSEFKDISKMSLGEMKKELRSLRNTPLEMVSSDQVASMKQRMALLTDAVGDYGKQLRASGDKTQSFIQGMQGMVGVVQGVTGTLALFGVQNEQVEKSLLAFMNISQSLSTIHDLNEKGILKNIAAKVKDIFVTKSETAALLAQTAALKANQGAQNFATKSPGVGASNAPYSIQTAKGFTMMGTTATAASGGVKVLGAALKALPLVGVIAAVVGLVYSLSNCVDTVKNLEEAETNWKNILKDNQALKDNKTIYDSLAISIRDLGLEYDVLVGKMSQSQAESVKDVATAEEQKKQLRANFVSWQLKMEEDTRKLILAKNEAFEASKLNAQNTNLKAQLENQKKHEKEILDIQNQANAEIERRRKIMWGQRKSADDRVAAANKVRDEQDSQRQAEKAKQDLETAKQNWQNYLNALKSWQQKVQDMQDEMIADEEQRDIAKMQRKRERELQDLKDSGLSISERGEFEKTITEYYEKELQKIRDKYAKEAVQKRKDTTEKLKNAMIGGMQAANDELQKLSEKRLNEDQKLWTLRSTNEQLSAKDRTDALLQLENMRWEEEKKKFKDNALILEQLAQEHKNNIDKINKQAAEDSGAIIWAEKWKSAMGEISTAIKSTLDDVIVGTAELLGQGKLSVESFGKLLLSSLADLAISVGKIAISMGTAILAIDTALANLGPVGAAAAILAGSALVAIGTWAKGALAGAAGGNTGGGGNPYQNLGGSMQGLATGGEVYKAGSFIVGERGPEVVTLPGRATVTSNDMLGGMQLVGVIQGNDLKIILDRTNARKNRV